ncbi:MAG: hypothetical protein K2H76_07400 [Muribaculaceae bacterium]|nr:hypothetical protein [Muribaculaceae bacterium]MDE6027773.1 hypothetical protein [Muribaculaceae bacterium]
MTYWQPTSGYVTEPSESLEVWADSISVINDGKTISTLTVYEKDVHDYTAFNMAIVVPEGVTVARVKQGREEVDDIHLTDRATSTHNITCGMPDSNTIKIISSSPSLANYFPTTDDESEDCALFTIGLVASQEIEPGEYNIELCDIKFVLESADAYILPEEPLIFPITIRTLSTGIMRIESTEGSTQKFDLQGRPINSEQTNGIYIVNGRKVLVE